jgi:hypothetical protein
MAKPADGIDWQAPSIIQTANGVKGVISSPTGTEEKPCFTCSKWIKDTRKLIQHFQAKGLKADARGVFTTPIVGDFKDGRRSMEIDPKDFGYCPAECMPTHMLATCERWQPVTLSRELAGKIRR